MACVAVSSLLGIVEQLQLLLLRKNNPSCLILPEIDIDDAEIILSTLKDKLHFLHAYLDDPDHVEAVEWLEIRDVAIKAEDEIEPKLGEVYLTANQLQGEAAACEDLHRSLRKVVKDFECVEVRIRDLQTRHTASIRDLENVRDGVSSSNYDLENTMIGVEGDFEKIKGMLIQTSSSTQLQVVSILGMEGTGRTTLAKKVYEDPSIVSHFDIQAWTVEGQVHSKRNLLIDILSCIVSFTNEQISKQDDEKLAEQLRKLLMGQRYFIVIDNLWTEEVWDELSTYFPDDRNGSRVLITTLAMRVATFASSSGMWIFRTRGLNPEESWELLSKTATSNGKCSSLSPEFEKIGRFIVEKCRGIPLVIVLIGGLLATLNSPRQWVDILFTIPSSEDTFKLLYYAIEVCYNYLPIHLKACFLYFGVFPENIEIHVKKLIKLWVAEGFINPEMNKSLEDIAKDYLCDLINRRLVQIHRRSLDKKIKSCMLHDTLHDFCLRRAITEDIMVVSRTEDNEFHKGRRWVSHQYDCRSIATSYFTTS